MTHSRSHSQLKARPGFLPTWAGRNGSCREGGEREKGPSAINGVVTRGHGINSHKRMRGVDFKQRAPPALRETWKFALKGKGTPGVHKDTRLDEAAWVRGVRNVGATPGHACPENVTGVKVHPTSPVHWSPVYLSPLSKIYTQLMCMKTNC